MTEAPAGATDFATLADAAWPALERVEAGGWQARFAEGVTKRANSAWWPCGSEPDVSPDALAAIEAAYREHALPPLFQLSGAQRAVRARLIGRGYTAVDETLVLAASFDSIPCAAADDVEVLDQPGSEWLSVWWSVDGRGGEAELEIARRILTGVPAVYAGLRIDGALVSVARLALVGDWGGLYCVATLPEHRRRGCSERVVAAALAAGAEHGAADAWLQVLARNQAAAALYARFGFAEVDRYQYLLGALRLPPAAVCRA